MIKILYIVFLSIVVSNCSFKKVVQHHGVPFLEKKQSLLIVNKCLEGDTGPFKIIPEFNSLKKSLNVDTSSMSGGEEINPEYYDRDNVLTIYNKSPSNVLPGRYTGEKINKSNYVNFLSGISTRQYIRW